MDPQVECRFKMTKETKDENEGRRYRMEMQDEQRFRIKMKNELRYRTIKVSELKRY